MSDLDSEPFANPIAPAGHKKQSEVQQPAQPLTNDDFRKLIQTPRVGTSGLGSVRKQEAASVRGRRSKDQRDGDKSRKKIVPRVQEDDYLAELSSRYRDRAKERREGANLDYQNDETGASASGYRAIPDLKSVADVAERRKKIIEESKYLGGDMEHTHLVKGLDYALLQKVKAEMHQQDDDDDDEKSEKGDDDEEKMDESSKIDDENEEDRYSIKSKLAANIVNLINQKLPDRNELFLPRRMAYVVNLEDEISDDVPTTIIRSRAECSTSESSSTLTTNDIVMNKLIQIWSYIRQGGSKKQKLKQTVSSRSETKPIVKVEDDSIYGDIGDYVPSASKSRKISKESSSSSRKYFESTSEESEEKPSSKLMELVHEVQKVGSKLESKKLESKKFESKYEKVQKVGLSKLGSKYENEPEGYAECYPGAVENDDAIIDSDDEADYSKMDAGSKKGGVGRWDFETNEEYSDYMGSKEALPKAAYQFGLKMSDGRKTRKQGGEKKKDGDAKLDRDLQKINAIINRRKEERGDRSKGGSDPEPTRRHRM